MRDGGGKVNSEGLNTQSKHYPMFELHTFRATILAHTPALPSQVLFLLTPPSAGPVKYTAYPRVFLLIWQESPSDRVSPPTARKPLYTRRTNAPPSFRNDVPDRHL